MRRRQIFWKKKQVKNDIKTGYKNMTEKLRFFPRALPLKLNYIGAKGAFTYIATKGPLRKFLMLAGICSQALPAVSRNAILVNILEYK